MPIFPAGRRWFVTASWATLATAAAHTLGNTLPAPPTDAASLALESAMRAYHLPLGLGMVPSMWDINRSLVFTMSICLAALGLLGIVLGTSREASPVLLRPVAAVLTLSSAALALLYFVYQVTPAFISMAVVTVLFVAAVIEARRSDARVWR